MSSVYSVRFLRVPYAAGTYTWVCPASRTAVVRSLTARNSASDAGAVVLVIAGVAVYQVALPSSGSSIHFDSRDVFGPGESVQLSISGSGVGAVVSGYLLDGAPPALAAQTYEPERAELLPA